jgi:hypothetical protein
VNDGGVLCLRCAVVDGITILSVHVDVIIVHGSGGPLDVDYCCGGMGVVFQGALVAPAGDVEWFVLIAISKVKEDYRGCGISCGGIVHSLFELVRVRGFGYAVMAKEAC